MQVQVSAFVSLPTTQLVKSVGGNVLNSEKIARGDVKFGSKSTNLS